MPKPKTTTQLKKELDKQFSIYIRKKFSNKDGSVNCYTCGQRKESWKQIQCGHFVSRQYLATRWDEDNCRPQCVGDNIFGNGKPLDFEERLKKEIGNKKVEELKKKRHQILKLDESWYIEKIQYYRNEIKKFNK